jgi:hypothetical protein
MKSEPIESEWKPFDLSSIGPKVSSILKQNIQARDDDKILVYEIWSLESKAITLTEFFQEFLSGKLSHFESIRRIRQKLQEMNPDLRGKKWSIRHRMEAVICQQLNFFHLW